MFVCLFVLLFMVRFVLLFLLCVCVCVLVVFSPFSFALCTFPLALVVEDRIPAIDKHSTLSPIEIYSLRLS